MRKNKIDFAACSLGGTGKENEDFLCVHNGDVSCFALADGLGGHSDGALAAQLAAQTACRSCENASEVSLELASRCFTSAQCAVVNAQKEQGVTCRTTLTLLLTDGRRAVYGHIGDSRVYHVRRKRIVSRTLDHSVPQLMVNMGTITEDALAHHPDRNRIIRAVGGEDDSFQFELSPILQINKSDSFLMCSDGFWEWIENKDITDALAAARDASEVLERLSRLSSQRAELPRDDSSAILVRLG